MIGIHVQTRTHSSQIYLKWTRLDAQMRGLWIFTLEKSKKRPVHGELGRSVSSQSDWEVKNWGARVDDRFWMFWSCLTTVGLHPISNAEFYTRRRCGSERHCTATLRTKSSVRARDDEQWKTNLDPDHIWRDERAQTSPEYFGNWNIVAWQSSSITIMIASFFETRRWICYLTIVIRTCTSFWRMEFVLAKRWWWLERVRQMTWTKKFTTTMENERNEAQEASAGDRRAIADGDRARQLEISGVAKTAESTTYFWTADRCCETGTQRDTCSIQSFGVQSVLRVVDEVLRTDELWWTRQLIHCRNSRQTTCSFEQWHESRIQPCITFVETRSGVVISFMGARKGGLRGSDQGNPATFCYFWFLQSSDHSMRQRAWVTMTCVEKLHANETPEQCYDLRQKQVIRATGLSKQSTDTYRDSHDATRHKLRRTLAYSFQQFHLPFHLRFVTLDLFSQDSQFGPTAEPHSNICLELHMYHFCACLVNRYLLRFPITKCVQPNWRTDGSVVLGGDETHRQTNTRWWRSKKEIPVLYWWFRNNCVPPSSSRTLRTKSHWSFVTGQCCYSEQFLPAYLPC